MAECSSGTSSVHLAKGMASSPDQKGKPKTFIRSPLRYPGAKHRLFDYVAETLRINSIRPKLLVEPFAGGLSVGVRLLNADLIDKLAVGEKDSLVASFWKVVFTDSEWLIDQVNRINVTLAKWDFFRANSFRTNRERALACLFLNRTSFSGILEESAGPIGGRQQTSDYKIDCRFNSEDLIRRIRAVSTLGHRVLFVAHADWSKTIARTEALPYKRNELFYYLDPPFYHKADRLYRWYFDDEEHAALCRSLAKLKHPWLLSYDPAEAIIKMYSSNGNGTKHINHLYSVASSGSRAKVRELLVTNLSKLPKMSINGAKKKRHQRN